MYAPQIFFWGDERTNKQTLRGWGRTYERTKQTLKWGLTNERTNERTNKQK